jgi:hypothetical protein
MMEGFCLGREWPTIIKASKAMRLDSQQSIIYEKEKASMP